MKNDSYNSERLYRLSETSRPTNEQRKFAMVLAKQHLQGEAQRYCKGWICDPKRTVSQLRQLVIRWGEQLPNDQFGREARG